MISHNGSRTRQRTLLICSAIAGAATLAALPVVGRSTEEARVREKLLGSWRLVTWEERDPSNHLSYPLGKDAVGQIQYTDDDRMSAQLVRPPPKRFASEDWRRAKTEEKSEAWGNYFGYFGTYSIDLKNNAVVHHIEGSWFPNLLGTDQIRHFRFEADRLILDADTEWGKVHIVWQKIGNKAGTQSKEH
jgi:Lipocalin-like domain